MEESSGVVAGNFAPPSRLYERLSYLSDYNWDQSIPPLLSVDCPQSFVSQQSLTSLSRVMTTGTFMEPSA